MQGGGRESSDEMVQTNNKKNEPDEDHVVDMKNSNKSSLQLEQLEVPSAAAEGPQESEWKTTFRGRSLSKGGWKTSPFIFGNEICEKLGAIGLQVNLVTYLVQQLNFKSAEAANTITNFGGTSSLTPLVGAFIADAYVGRYWVVVVGSILYTLGTMILTMQAMFPSLRPPHCNPSMNLQLHQSSCKHATPKQMRILYLAFFFLATGSGGIRPCVAAFGADQFNEEDPKQRNQIRHFFNWYFFSLAISFLTTVTVFVYIQENVGWSLGFGIPAICMALSIVSFLVGTPIYRTVKPTGSPLGRLIQVVVAALRKHKLVVPDDPNKLFEISDKENSSGARLQHTNQFRFLDKAAIVTEQDNNSRLEPGSDSSESQQKKSKHINPWRLCSVHQVEELKLLLRMLPIWTMGMLVFTAWSQQGTFWVQQGRTMDRRIWKNSKFEIPPSSMSAFGMITLIIWIPIYDKVGIPLLRKLTGHERGISILQRIGVGLFLSIFMMVSAGFVEVKRRNAARDAGLLDRPHETVPISVFWLLPQYILTGLMESFMSIGQMEFFYDQSPENMRSMATAIFWTVVAAGSYLSSFLVTIIQKYSSRSSTGDWLANNINRAHLDYFYWLLAGLLAINFIVFLGCARWYKYKKWNNNTEKELQIMA